MIRLSGMAEGYRLAETGGGQPVTNGQKDLWGKGSASHNVSFHFDRESSFSMFPFPFPLK